MASPVFVTAQKIREADCDFFADFADLKDFKFHQRHVEVDWPSGEVCVKFKSWGEAQKAVKKYRSGDRSLWNYRESYMGHIP